jgi:hypothetical protein
MVGRCALLSSWVGFVAVVCVPFESHETLHTLTSIFYAAVDEEPSKVWQATKSIRVYKNYASWNRLRHYPDQCPIEER